MKSRKRKPSAKTRQPQLPSNDLADTAQAPEPPKTTRKRRPPSNDSAGNDAAVADTAGGPEPSKTKRADSRTKRAKTKETTPTKARNTLHQFGFSAVAADADATPGIVVLSAVKEAGQHTDDEYGEDLN